MTTRPAPYAAATRAKGWRFELDYERVEQSATWGLTTLKPEARPWLLMTWYTAWKQTPCGSMPADQEVFAGLIGASDAVFSRHRKILLRGWWIADDGRLYHDTLVQCVQQMLKQRRSDADRQAANRTRKAAGLHAVSPVTPPEVHPKSSTGTSTSTRTNKTEDEEQRDRALGEGEELPDLTGFQPTPGGAACQAIKAVGIVDVNPSHPDLARLLAAGVTPQELADAAKVLVGKGKAKFSYLLSTVEGRRLDAAAKAAVPAKPAGVVIVPNGEADKTAAYLRQQAARGGTKPPADLLAKLRGNSQEQAA